MAGIKKIIFGESKYLAKEYLGKGQFGVVYKAIPRIKRNSKGVKLPKYVAIKEYYYSRFYNPAINANFCEEYFNREIKNLELQEKYQASQLKIYDYGKSKNKNEYYIVLSYIEGKTLREWYSDVIGINTQLSEDDIHQLTHDIILPIARHLNFCHDHGLVHRDLTVDNILIISPKDSVAVPVIIDWGAGKILDPNFIKNPPKNYIKDKTFSGTAFINKGTPPEIIMGLEPLAASDIYMLGHLMYFIYSGGHLARTPSTKDEYILHPKNENPKLDERYDELVAKCTQYEPCERFHSMTQLIHAIEKIQENFTPSRITFFKKKQNDAALSADTGPHVTGTPIPSPATGDDSMKAFPPEPASTNASGDYPPPFQSSSPPNNSGNLKQTLSSKPLQDYARTPTYVDDWGARGGSEAQINKQAGQNAQDNVSEYDIPYMPNIPREAMLSNFNQQDSIERIQKQFTFIKSLETIPIFDDTTKTYAKSFIQYFSLPNWPYLRQDAINYYWYFLNGIKIALEKKKTLVRFDKITGNIYYIGRLVGSINDLRKIIGYFSELLMREPESKIVFLGNYFTSNPHDVEMFTYLLSFYVTFPENIILLRGYTETREIIETKGTESHLNFKFGGNYPYIKDLILQIISRLDIIHIAELTPAARACASGGGIPVLIENPHQPLDLENIAKAYSSIPDSINSMDNIAKSIILGRPNEVSQSFKIDSDGRFLFGWFEFNQFLAYNGMHYMFLPYPEKYGHRTLWNKISLLNSATYENNKPKNYGKIIQLNRVGSTEIDILKLS